jgi:hypothetical protein
MREIVQMPGMSRAHSARCGIRRERLEERVRRVAVSPVSFAPLAQVLAEFLRRRWLESGN